MKIAARIVISLAVVCIGLGIILLGVSLLTCSGVEDIMTHQIVPPYIDAALGAINSVLSRITGAVTAVFITG